jgi:integrase
VRSACAASSFIALITIGFRTTPRSDSPVSRWIQCRRNYFTREEFDKVLKTVDEYAFPVDAPKKRAQLRGLVLLMRWSGLRLGDAVRLERARVADGKLILYKQKTFCLFGRK